MSYGFGPRLSTGAGSIATTCPTAPYGPQVSSIKKSLADVPVHLGMHIPNTRTHVSKAPHVRAIIRLQDVRACSVVNTYIACRQTSIVRLQCDVNTMDHSSGTATVPSDSIAQRNTADRVRHGK
jgi:hypothetical protein